MVDQKLKALGVLVSVHKNAKTPPLHRSRRRWGRWYAIKPGQQRVFEGYAVRSIDKLPAVEKVVGRFPVTLRLVTGTLV
jgi:hypothetical protein